MNFYSLVSIHRSVEGEFTGVGKKGQACIQLARILQYLECPQYVPHIYHIISVLAYVIKHVCLCVFSPFHQVPAQMVFPKTSRFTVCRFVAPEQTGTLGGFFELLTTSVNFLDSPLASLPASLTRAAEPFRQSSPHEDR